MTVAQRGPLALLDSPADLLRSLFGTANTDSKENEVSQSSVVGWLTLVAILLLGAVQAFAVSSFGDIARYLDNKPGNVGVRHDIKAAGRDIIKALHDSDRYDRIVIVGHSLGSIIGLDMITSYWAQVHDHPGHPVSIDQDRLKEVEKLGTTITAEDPAYSSAQRDLWLEQRALGIPWLLTDFISVGSPLSHADWLMADGRVPLEELFTRRELLHNPPQVDGPGHPYSFPISYATQAGERSLYVLHHAAAFACTRWTNIWFPTRWGLFDDPFGGPLADLFGIGVMDRPVTAGPWSPRYLPVLAHVMYWRKPDPDPDPEHPDGHHITLLRWALDLDSDDWLK